MAKTKFESKKEEEVEPEVEPETEPEVEEEVTLEREGPAMMRIRLNDREQERGSIQYDWESGLQWMGKAVLETPLTRFVSERLGKTLQEATNAEYNAYVKSLKK